jgi:hypothetical protein
VCRRRESREITVTAAGRTTKIKLKEFKESIRFPSPTDIIISISIIMQPYGFPASETIH